MSTIPLPYQVAIDASFRRRSSRAQGASVIRSVRLFEQNDRDRKVVVHNMISVCHHKGIEIPLAVLCGFARDGKRCYMRGMEKEWKKKIAAGGRERDDALPIELFFRLCHLFRPRGTAGGRRWREDYLPTNPVKGLHGYTDLP